MPILLHGDFSQITITIILQLILGSIAEKALSLYRASLVYILSGLGGVLSGSLANDIISVGASSAAFGLCAALVFLYTTDYSLDGLYLIGKYLTLRTVFVIVICACASLFSVFFS